MSDILIIDDDPGFRRIIARTLAAEGHQISEAKAGIDGVAAFHARHPALVITEIVMSGKEGMETLRELRREAPNLPILAVSGNIHAAFYLHAATILGANAALEKPLSSSELLSAVAKLLPRQRHAAISIAARSESRSTQKSGTIIAKPTGNATPGIHGRRPPMLSRPRFEGSWRWLCASAKICPRLALVAVR